MIRKNQNIIVFVFLVLFSFPAYSANPLKHSKLPYPVINEHSWVMIEIWPDVQDITLSAYFLDFSYDKNKNLCTATKRVFDRAAKPSETSYRLCMSVSDAIAQEYIYTR